MKKKIRVGIVFGGKSAEHEVSLQSAENIITALDKAKYEILKIKIDKKGEADFALLKKVDVVLPILHGPFGEDGTIQGMFKLMGVPFVGSGVLGSAIGMDKEITKRLLRDAGIPINKFLVFTDPAQVNFNSVKKSLGMPVFVKPANMGSSVGVSKVTNIKELEKAVKLAFQYDRKILIEEMVKGREVECSVLGNDDPIASIPGEIIPRDGFYSYEAKYIDENGAQLEIPAKLSMAVAQKVRAMAIATFKALNLEGMARIDFFLKENGELLVNEANTIPGFTKVSMYPKLWEVSGISYPKLLDRLIKLAIERYKKEKKLKTNY